MWKFGLVYLTNKQVPQLHCYAMPTNSYKVTLLTELPEALRRPHTMDTFHAFAPYATDGPLEIKAVYHLPACDDTKEYIAVVKAAVQETPGKYVDVLYSPPHHWQSSPPMPETKDVVTQLLRHGAPPLSVIRYLIRPTGLTPHAAWGLI